jgi:hypothetical protein
MFLLMAAENYFLCIYTNLDKYSGIKKIETDSNRAGKKSRHLSIESEEKKSDHTCRSGRRIRDAALADVP